MLTVSYTREFSVGKGQYNRIETKPCEWSSARSPLGPCDAKAGPHLYDPAAQPRPLCQLLEGLSIRVIVLSKLGLHDLEPGQRYNIHFCAVHRPPKLLRENIHLEITILGQGNSSGDGTTKAR